METKIIYILLSLFAGFIVTIQGPINSLLSKSTNLEFSTMMSFLTGFLVIFIYYILKGMKFPKLSELSQMPAYYFVGGILGLIFVMLLMFVISKLGAAPTTTLLIVAQILTAILIDRLGLFGLEVKMITINKIIGTVLMLSGVFLIVK